MGGKEVVKEGSKKRRRAYHKPQVEQVELIAEEQVLGNCKTSAGTTEWGIGSVQPCFVIHNCKEDGT